MLSLNEKKHFEFTWDGTDLGGRVIAKFSSGFVAFNYRPGPKYFGSSLIEESTVPAEILYSNQEGIVNRTKFDSLEISFTNIFVNLKHDLNSQRGFDLLKKIKHKPTKIDDLKLEVFIGGRSTISHFPLRTETTLDTLVVKLSGKNKVGLNKVNQYVDGVSKVIALYTSMPADPLKIELGVKSDKSEYFYDVAFLEHSKHYEYSDLKLNVIQALDFEKNASNFIQNLVTVLSEPPNLGLSLWFSYVESEYKRYYLDNIMSILLSCAENVFYRLPKPDTSKREVEFDTFIKELDKAKISSTKLRKFILKSRRNYVEPTTYEQKIRILSEYSEHKVKHQLDFPKYLSQLRNKLMHGLQPNWSHFLDENGNEKYPIDLFNVKKDLHEVVSLSIKKQLS